MQSVLLVQDSCKTPEVVRQKNMVICPAELGTKKYCAGEGQQQFTPPIDYWYSDSWPGFFSYFVYFRSTEL
jgi:hypothetical protein